MAWRLVTLPPALLAPLLGACARAAAPAEAPSPGEPVL